MDKFKYPQYLTPNGFVRSAKKPKPTKTSLAAKKTLTPVLAVTKPAAPTKLRILAEQRVLARQKLERRGKGISDEAAKAIAEALTAMIHSR